MLNTVWDALGSSAEHILTFPFWRSPVPQGCNSIWAVPGGIASPKQSSILQTSLTKVHEHQFCTQSRQTRVRISPKVCFLSPNHSTVGHCPPLPCTRTLRKSPWLSATVPVPVTKSAPAFGSRVQASQGALVFSPDTLCTFRYLILAADVK